MNAEDLSRSVDAKFVSSAKLFDYKLAFTLYSPRREGGVADIVKSKGDHLEGVLLEVPDFVGLDIREGHPTVYFREEIEVQNLTTGEFVKTQTYMVVNKTIHEVRPSEYYASLITSGATQFLSKEYQEALRVNLLLDRLDHSQLAPEDLLVKNDPIIKELLI